jgi:hypothetical protein
MKIVVGIGIALAAAWGLARLGRIPVKHRNLDARKLENLLYTLLHNGSDRSVLVVRVRKDDRFVQFRVRIPPGGAPGLEFGFPRAPWSEPFYEEVAALLREHAVPFERVSVDVGAVTEFLVVDFGTDVEGAQRLTTTLLAKVYGVVPERDCFAMLEGDFSSRALAGTGGG